LVVHVIARQRAEYSGKQAPQRPLAVASCLNYFASILGSQQLITLEIRAVSVYLQGKKDNAGIFLVKFWFGKKLKSPGGL